MLYRGVKSRFFRDGANSSWAADVRFQRSHPRIVGYLVFSPPRIRGPKFLFVHNYKSLIILFFDIWDVSTITFCYRT